MKYLSSLALERTAVVKIYSPDFSWLDMGLVICSSLMTTFFSISSVNKNYYKEILIKLGTGDGKLREDNAPVRICLSVNHF